MADNYQFLDAYGSVLTASSDDVGGAQQPIVQIGSVLVTVPVVLSGNPSISGTIGASIIGQLPAGVALLGSVATLQGTNPWVVSGSVMLLNGANVIGSVTALQGTNPWITTFANSSVFAVQQGTRVTSVIGSIPSSLLTGVHGHRNDAVASYLGTDLSWRPIATDSAGRPVTKPFAPEEARVEGYVALTSTSLTTLVAAGGAGIRNYITDLWFANTGATTTLVTLSDSAGSILGYTIAPTGSGSNLPGLVTPIRTGANASFNIQAGSNTSILYATVKGFKAP